MNQDDDVYLGRRYEETLESRKYRLQPTTRKEREEQEYKKEMIYGNENGTLRIVEAIMQETVNNRFNQLRNKVNNKK